MPSGTYSGCGRQTYVPCLRGTDCADCGRARSSGKYDDRRRLEGNEANRAPRQLPHPRDREATMRFLDDVRWGVLNGTVRDYRLPGLHMSVLDRLLSESE